MCLKLLEQSLELKDYRSFRQSQNVHCISNYVHWGSSLYDLLQQPTSPFSQNWQGIYKTLFRYL